MAYTISINGNTNINSFGRKTEATSYLASIMASMKRLSPDREHKGEVVKLKGKPTAFFRAGRVYPMEPLSF